jgi:hypothetical protein
MAGELWRHNRPITAKSKINLNALKLNLRVKLGINFIIKKWLRILDMAQRLDMAESLDIAQRFF